jgi:ribulose-5-phosphate 4-epimerase/fuculose-1-phosphate aldolase
MALNVAYPKNAAVKDSVSAAEWQARIDLAAAYRFIGHKEWDGGIFNHLSLRVPDEPTYFLMKPNDLMFEEVTASSLKKLDMKGPPQGFSENINAAGFTIHSAVLNARPDLMAVCHIHTAIGEAISARKNGFRCLTQGSMKFYNRLGYHDFEGVAEEPGECERLSADLGPHKAMILRNHGLLTCGRNMAEAVGNLQDLMGAAEAQLRIEATGADINEVPAEVCEKAARQFEAFFQRSQNRTEWAALLRLMDRVDSSYRN